MSNGGINFHGNKMQIRLRCFVADAPARAYILNHRGHTSCNPCSKCKVSGTCYEGHYVFNGINHSLRTDEEYNRCLDEEHHRGNSPLSMLPIGMVSQVSFEYMHLVCLGVTKTFICVGTWKVLTSIKTIWKSHLCFMFEIKKYWTDNISEKILSVGVCETS